MKTTEPVSVPASPPPASAAKLPVLFTDFLRLFFTYPDRSTRVQRAAGELLDEITRSGPGAALRLQGDHLVAGPERLPADQGGRLGWLKRCFDRCALAGLEFPGPLDLESLTAFAGRFRDNLRQRTRTASFPDLWPAPFPGVRLLERRYAGTFGAGPDEGDGSGPLPPGAAPPAPAPARALESAPASSADRILLELIESRPEVQETLTRLFQVLEAREGEPPPAGEAMTLDPVQLIAGHLPAEAARDPVRAARMAASILSTAGQALQALDRAAHEDQERRLHDLLSAVASRFFAAAASSQSETVPTPHAPAAAAPASTAAPGLPAESAAGGVRPEPIELKPDELHALAREVDALPTPPPPRIETEAGTLGREALGVLIHRLAQSGAEGVPAPVRTQLEQALETSGPEERELLVPYLTGFFRSSVREDRHELCSRVFHALRPDQVAWFLRESRSFNASVVVDGFPEHFPLFLDTLDPRSPNELGRIADVCSVLGPERIAEAEAVLGSPRGILTIPRLTRVLSLPRLEVLPLVEIVVRHGSRAQRAQAAGFLKKFRLATRGAAALEALPADRLPPGYLEALCRAARAGADPDDLQEQSERMLLRFLELPARTEEDVQARKFAVYALRDCRSPEALRLLRRIGGMASSLLRREPAPVRQAAREVLEVLSLRLKA
jgi:hypothetical protein